MKNNRFVIIDIPFNYLRYNNDRLTKEWILTRLDIFFKTALKSFKCQTTQNFIVIIGCEGESMDIINEALQEREPLPNNIRFVEYRQRLALILQIVREYEYFFHVRIDSDNLYRNNFIQKLYDLEIKPDTEALLCQYGYLLDLRNNKLAYMFHTSPSFYALVYKTSDYLLGKRYRPESHRVIINYKVQLLNDYYYIITITGENVQFNESFMKNKKLVEEEDKRKILCDFGLVD